MILPNQTVTGQPQLNWALAPERSQHAGLRSTGWDQHDANILLTHIGREAFHGSKTRDFKNAWNKNPTTGAVYPKYYRVGTEDLSRCQYAILTDKRRAAVLIIDIDAYGTPGGRVGDLAPQVHETLGMLAAEGLCPSWVGVNPMSGKGQVLWMIDPVYAGAKQSSSNSRLLAVATRELNTLLGGDVSFSHRFSRWPLHVSDDPAAYKWHCQHHEITRVGSLLEGAREMTGSAAPQKQPDQQYSSGWARIEAARESSRRARDLAALDAELSSSEELAGDLIDGVRVHWITTGRAARDETAFRHALAEAYRLRAAGERMTDAKIINAYERAYEVAQAVGSDDREPELPKMEDRLTMARRVRGYVISGKSVRTAGKPVERMSSAGRKALATMGRKGGQTAAQRWHTDPDYAAVARKPLEKSATQRRVEGNQNRAKVLEVVSGIYRESGRLATWSEVITETGLSRATVARHLAFLRRAGLLP